MRDDVTRDFHVITKQNNKKGTEHVQYASTFRNDKKKREEGREKKDEKKDEKKVTAAAHSFQHIFFRRDRSQLSHKEVHTWFIHKKKKNKSASGIFNAPK